MLILYILLIAFALSCADEGVYVDTNAVTNGEDNLGITSSPLATLTIKTSNAYLSGTKDSISVFFTGDFSSSGMHRLGSFTQGESISLNVKLTRSIGKLLSIIIYNSGTEGWLPSSVSCSINGVLYVMESPRQWVDSLDPSLLAATGNGYEPNDQEALPAAPELFMTVAETVQLYTTYTEL